MKKFLSLALALSSLLTPAWAETLPRVVTVSGKGTVQVAPDRASVTYQFIDEQRFAAAGGVAKSAAAAVPSLVRKNNARVAPAVSELKQVVGNDGTVEVLPSIHRMYEYNQQTGKNVLVGYRVVSTIQVKLEGRRPIEQKLGELFDTSRVGADEVSEPVMSLTEPTLSAAQKQANQQAVDDAVATANSQLEKGESLGAALQRGERVNVPSPRLEMASRAMADAPSGGQAIVETGKVTVQTMIQFVFEVVGAPARLGVQAGGSAAGQPGS